MTNAKAKPAKAQLLAAMYDKSLDAIYPHNWYFSLDFASSMLSAQWNTTRWSAIGLYGYQNYQAYNVRDLSFSHFDPAMEGVFNPFIAVSEVLMASGHCPYSRSQDDDDTTVPCRQLCRQ